MLVPVAAHFADLGTTAANVHHVAIPQLHLIECAQCAVIRFPFTIQYLQIEADFLGDFVQKGGAIGGITHGAGSGGNDAIHGVAVAKPLEEAEGEEGAGNGRIAQTSCCHPFPQPHHLPNFIFQAVGVAGDSVQDDQPGRV